MKLRNLIPERIIHRIFEVGVIVKGVDGCLETLGGVLLLLVNPERLTRWIVALTQHELSEDPSDFIATHLRQTFQHYTADTRIFASLYLVLHGIIKIFLVWGLLRNKLWAYPASIAFLITFIAYQVYRYQHTQAFGLLLLTGFDVLIIGLTWHEWRHYVKYRQFS